MPRPRLLSLTELSALLPRIHATMKQLAGGSRRGPDAAAKTNGRRARNGRLTRASGAQLQSKLLALLQSKKKGLGLGDIVERAGAARSAVKYHLRALRRHEKVRVVGNRQLARWLAA